MERPRTSAQFLWDAVFHDQAREIVVVVFLDCRHAAIGYSVAFMGAVCRCNVSPREILAMALLHNAAGIVLAHNHPSSGNPSPSGPDLDFTGRLREAGAYLGVPLIDHLIIGGGSSRWYSFHDSGLLYRPGALMNTEDLSARYGPEQPRSELRARGGSYALSRLGIVLPRAAGEVVFGREPGAGSLD
jgi:hypothetical protein